MGDLTSEEWGWEKTRFHELKAELEVHPGTIAHQRWTTLQRSYAIFRGNHHDLINHLRRPETDPDLGAELIQNVRPPDARDAFTAELDRRLHNYVAAAGTLIDQTRTIVDHYPPETFPAYSQRRAMIVEAPVARFVKRLRNYLLHCDQAPFRFTLRIDPEHGDKGSVSLVSDWLLKWDDWGKARRYIEDAGEDVVLVGVVEAYTGMVDQLQAWLSEEFAHLVAPEIDAANRLRKEINEMLTGRTLDDPPAW